jgi:hypothetical protein
MTSVLHMALLADGTGDRALFPVIRWTLRHLWPEGEFSQSGFFPRRHRPVSESVDEILQHYSPDIVNVHRDAETMPLEDRLREIPERERIVPVVPVRMTEAWRLIDEAAIRMAASNPNGTVALGMPALRSLENIPAPKTVLHDLLKTASGNTGRRLRNFQVEKAVHRVSELIDDYSPLERLSAYAEFRKRLGDALRLMGKISR